MPSSLRPRRSARDPLPRLLRISYRRTPAGPGPRWRFGGRRDAQTLPGTVGVVCGLSGCSGPRRPAGRRARSLKLLPVDVPIGGIGGRAGPRASPTVVRTDGAAQNWVRAAAWQRRLIPQPSMRTGANSNRPSPRRPRWRALVALLLGLVYLAQPALALAGAACPDRDCGTAPACCCSEGGSPPPVEPRTVASPADCCVEDPAAVAGPVPRAGGACACSADPAPPAPRVPALPPDGRAGAGDGSLAQWIRAQAELFARTPGGSPGIWGADTSGRATLASWRPRWPRWPLGALSGGASTLVPAAAGTTAWTLLVRGVPACLAVLSVARR